MRLLHTQDLVFKEFIGDDKPNYAILSHRWGDDEVSFQDFDAQRKASIEGHATGYGWTKIVWACHIAQSRHLEWVWVDTCCIDKKSSAELSEAINSMFDWYWYSEECYVFLPDVHEVQDLNSGEESVRYSGEQFFEEKPVPFDENQFKSSTWFTRAWTLQELLAPSELFFFNSEFMLIGTNLSLASLISEASSIPQKYFSLEFFQASVAQRMAWASRRQATRREDVAYSLLGLFGVNMPLLYGEGDKAFLRLQLEIIRSSHDESIFVWLPSKDPGGSNVLAPNISAFSRSHNISFDFTYTHPLRPHYEVTNHGVRMSLSLNKKHLLRRLKETSFEVLIPLQCLHDYEERPALLVCVEVTSSARRQNLPWFLSGWRSKMVLVESSVIEGRCSTTGIATRSLLQPETPTQLDLERTLIAGQGGPGEIEMPLYMEV